MKVTANPYRNTGLDHPDLTDVPDVSTDVPRVATLLSKCPRAAETPLIDASEMARDLGIGQVFLKDERDRMGLGSFKALGAAYVIARDAADGKAAGQTYVTASAGNHGLSVAAGAAAFGANAVVFISEQVPEAFAARLTNIGAQVVRDGATYEDSMATAANAATEQGAFLLSDSSWVGYLDRPHTLMEGYLVLMDEVARQIPEPPTHILLQAGVGGLAASAAALARAVWGDVPNIIVVEPEVAPALVASIAAGGPITTEGPVSAMGRLDCKEPSLIALKSLARDADAFATITEDEGFAGTEHCARHGFASTPSGTAGIAALVSGAEPLGIDQSSRVLAILSEGPE